MKTIQNLLLLPMPGKIEVSYKMLTDTLLVEFFLCAYFWTVNEIPKLVKPVQQQQTFLQLGCVQRGIRLFA
jgi:hypothetical protein